MKALEPVFAMCCCLTRLDYASPALSTWFSYLHMIGPLSGGVIIWWGHGQVARSHVNGRINCADICQIKNMISLGKHRITVYWNHSNHADNNIMFCIHGKRIYTEVHADLKHTHHQHFQEVRAISIKTGYFLKDGLSKYEVSDYL